MFTSASSAITGPLLLSLPNQLPGAVQPRQPLGALGLFHLRRFAPGFGALADTAILLHDRFVMVPNVALHRLNLFDRQHRHDFANLLVGVFLLKVGHEVLNGDAAGGKLWPPAVINDHHPWSFNSVAPQRWSEFG